MPLFEIEPDRPLLLNAAETVPANTFPAATLPATRGAVQDVVDHHIDALIGEQVFPVRIGHDIDAPHLLALDASGAPVVVEFVARLDGETLARGLDHAGAAGRMTRAQLTEQYEAGHDAFHDDLAAFYDTVPIKWSVPGGASVRLIIICQEADDHVLNAVDFLRQPSMPVEILRVDLVQGAHGRRFVNVSPLAIKPDSLPSQPQVLTPALSEGLGQAVGQLAGGAVDAGQAVGAGVAVSGGDPSGEVRAGLAGTSRDMWAAPAGMTGVVHTAQADDVHFAAVAAAGPAPGDPGNWETVDPADTHAVPIPAAQEGKMDEQLVALARSMGQSAQIVWDRPRRRQRFTATLTADGHIVTESGATFRHPDSAARAVSGASAVDGWSQWRLGNTGGPSLLEAYRDLVEQ